ncbi:Nucleotide-diphospho-sugar transferase [Mucilaginibacter gossypiicola]|uniref:Nucleotide-diphospho-sugar transferase n=1 Tax=Mucilaginibacter gossypiicola TaxID=551995 RepID=A0A1H8B9T5_9SPHI|nr:putative nucleotide-diphospho-sugar transferase [Mucilaginibacter gossypiicola]SEM79563.1 Nucleotide-diphospho-sugar transferase [Mucilaginibacter gossypiicola]
MAQINKRMKLFSIYTDELSEIKDVFSGSIRDDWDVHIKYMGRAGDGNGDFASKGFYYIQQRKIEFLIEKIKENWDDVIIYADIDIQFFDKCSGLIEHAIYGKDFAFQPEHGSGNEVNVGFSVIRCNEKTLAVYKLILQYDFEILPIADQSAMNDILQENKTDVIWGLLPKQFWAMSHYMSELFAPPNDIVIHHANGTRPRLVNGERIGSVQLKMEQFQMIRNYIDAQKELELVTAMLQTKNSVFSDLLSAIEGKAMGNEASDEETQITFAFYLHVSLIKIINLFVPELFGNTPLLYDGMMRALFLPFFDSEEVGISYLQNKEMLSEICQDVQSIELEQPGDIPAWLISWTALCNEMLLEPAINTGDYRGTLKRMGCLINQHLKLSERSKYVLFYFIRETFSELARSGQEASYS